jgi:hypothetical protein
MLIQNKSLEAFPRLGIRPQAYKHNQESSHFPNKVLCREDEGLLPRL